MRHDNISMLEDTLAILERGYYVKGGRKVVLKLTREQMEEARVFLPNDVKKAGKNKDFQHVHVIGRCGYGCENMDSFSLARKRIGQLLNSEKNERILVLNLTNPVNPGGGVRRGAKAQEEDLCRKSSLLVKAIADQWKQGLELSDVILEMADDLCHGCQMHEFSHYRDPEWLEKYMKMHRPVKA